MKTLSGSRQEKQRLVLVMSCIGAWCAALLIVGIVYSGEAWAAVCLGAALVSAAAAGVCALMRSWFGALYSTLAVTAAGMIIAGALGASGFLAAGVLGLIFIGAAFPIALRLETGGAASSSSSETGSSDTRRILQEILEHSMLSDNAKRVLFREREIGLLRDAIESDIGASEYNAAIALCDEMANVFGYRDEAEAFRARIMRARQERFDFEVRAALDQFDQLLEAHNWARVHEEAAKIRRLYGESHLVQNLDQRIVEARENHKRELEQQFLHAANRDDVEGAMILLRQLDRYLTREEAERLSEVANGVVTRHKENLGVQFKLAVNDRRWTEAVRIGELIVEEFPNSMMADEVRSMIDLLRSRAAHGTALSQA